jgi:hypothetical protein
MGTVSPRCSFRAFTRLASVTESPAACSQNDRCLWAFPQRLSGLLPAFGDCSWAWPINVSAYDRNPTLSEVEHAALSSRFKEGQTKQERNSIKLILHRLLQPIEDVLTFLHADPNTQYDMGCQRFLGGVQTSNGLRTLPLLSPEGFAQRSTPGRPGEPAAHVRVCVTDRRGKAAGHGGD